ncbi:MAG TPA: hypothetical protein VK790_00325 [Solirubrobacteraceae bacterium]|nr:hypothetical protein [Solirubrobacteraceae bacterium]
MGASLACVLALAGAVAAVSAAGSASAASPAVGTGARVAPARAAEHFACSGPAAANQPCYFSTPSGNVRCAWMPHTNTVTCELLATRRAYRLGATGHARSVSARLSRHGETLPTNQLLSFPEKLSCQDTRTTMTCNQDEGFGEFKLAPHGSHSA